MRDLEAYPPKSTFPDYGIAYNWNPSWRKVTVLSEMENLQEISLQKIKIAEKLDLRTITKPLRHWICGRFETSSK